MCYRAHLRLIRLILCSWVTVHISYHVTKFHAWGPYGLGCLNTWQKKNKNKNWNKHNRVRQTKLLGPLKKLSKNNRVSCTVVLGPLMSFSYIVLLTYPKPLYKYGAITLSKVFNSVNDVYELTEKVRKFTNKGVTTPKGWPPRVVCMNLGTTRQHLSNYLILQVGHYHFRRSDRFTGRKPRSALKVRSHAAKFFMICNGCYDLLVSPRSSQLQ